MSLKQGQRMSYVKSNVMDSLQKLPRLKTIPDYLEYHANTQGDKEAMVFVNETSRVSVTWSELYDKVTSVAKSLVSLGVIKGDCVVVYLRDSPEWCYVVFGAMMAGAYVIPFYYVDKSWENVFSVIERVETCSVLIVEATDDKEPIETLLGNVENDGRVTSDRFPYLKYFITQDLDMKANLAKGNDINCFLTNSNQDEALPSLDENDVALCLFSSGSTGPSKLLAFSNRIYVQHSISMYGGEPQQFLKDDALVEYNERPLAWKGGFPLSFVTGHKRVTCTIPERHVAASFRARKVMDIIQTERCNFVSMLPSALNHFVGIQVPEHWPVKIVRITTSPNKTLNLLGTFTSSFYIMYVSGEIKIVSSWIITKREDFVSHKVGKITSFKPTEVKIVDDNGDVVPVGVRGEIHVRTSTSFLCYLKDPERTKAYRTEDGWCRTDDIGMMKEENGDIELYVFTRKSNMILTNGNKMVPELLERVIERLNPSIQKAVIVPVPDEAEFQAMCACVKLETGCELNVADMHQMFKRLQDERPADYKAIPKHWMVVDHFPLVKSGKVSRLELAEMASAYVETNTQN